MYPHSYAEVFLRLLLIKIILQNSQTTHSYALQNKIIRIDTFYSYNRDILSYPIDVIRYARILHLIHYSEQEVTGEANDISVKINYLPASVMSRQVNYR
jgi:hypothetical protein